MNIDVVMKIDGHDETAIMKRPIDNKISASAINFLINRHVGYLKYDKEILENNHVTRIVSPSFQNVTGFTNILELNKDLKLSNDHEIRLTVTTSYSNYDSGGGSRKTRRSRKSRKSRKYRGIVCNVR
jgi:hypothetical protein